MKVAFKMLTTSPKDRKSPEEVITELQKIYQSLTPPPKPEQLKILLNIQNLLLIF